MVLIELIKIQLMTKIVITIAFMFVAHLSFAQDAAFKADVLKVTLSQRLMYPISYLSVKDGSRSGFP